MRDSQRSKVYKAERACGYFHTRRIEVVSDIQAWLDKITGSAWYKKYKLVRTDGENRGLPFGKYSQPYFRNPNIKVLDGRGRRSACATNGWMKLPKWSRTKLIILHEMAHAIQIERPGHGRQFCMIYLDLVKRWIGIECYRALRASFRKHKVKVGVKRRSTNKGNPEALKKYRENKLASCKK